MGLESVETSSEAAAPVVDVGSESTETDTARAPRARSRRVAPVNAERRERKALAERKKRRIERLRDLPIDQLDALIASAEAPKAPAASSPSSETGATVQPAQQTEPGQLPGWPSPTTIAEQLPLALMIWGGLASKLEGTRYSKCLAVVEHELATDDGATVRVRVEPVAKLAQATAPVFAKYMPSGSSLSPEGALLLSVAMIFGPTALGHGSELVQAWLGLGTGTGATMPMPAHEEAH